MGSVITYAIFTVFPIIMFSIILVVKLRDNYVNEIDKFSNNLYQMDEKFNNCRIDFDISQNNVARLSRIKGTCIETLNRVSETMELLTTAFVSRQNLSQN